jgi:hypothetical protein
MLKKLNFSFYSFALSSLKREIKKKEVKKTKFYHTYYLKSNFFFFLSRKLLKKLRISGSELGERLFKKK